MATFQELYQTLLAAQARSNLPEAIKYIRTQQDFDPKQLDCLLNPQKHPLVWRTGECGCAPGEGACERACSFDAIHSAPEEGGRVAIDVTRCVGCSACIDACAAKKLEASRDAVAAMEAVRRHEGPVYALVAPAFMGQFSEAVTPGMLRSAFLRLGFDGMIEVALFADILTLKEALEFDKNITREGDFQLTSCCCPLWIAMIRKIYSELQSHLPASVSPMIACGRSVKALHPDALTIFVGPCIAKKAEAREKDLAGAVDYAAALALNSVSAQVKRPLSQPKKPCFSSTGAAVSSAGSGILTSSVFMTNLTSVSRPSGAAVKTPYSFERST